MLAIVWRHHLVPRERLKTRRYCISPACLWSSLFLLLLGTAVRMIGNQYYRSWSYVVATAESVSSPQSCILTKTPRSFSVSPSARDTCKLGRLWVRENKLKIITIYVNALIITPILILKPITRKYHIKTIKTLYVIANNRLTYEINIQR